jgi:thiamine biosynthesis lipoprotein
MITSSRWSALGTTASVFVTEPGAIFGARELLEADLDRIDRACSRFRPDSELTRVNEADGDAIEVSDLLIEAVEVALRIARATDGAVDPTLGRAIRNLGYDRDFDELGSDVAPPAELPPHPGWRSVSLDRRSRRIRVPAGVELDLGASAKALAADRAATRIADSLGCGVMVNLGGDIAIAGPPPDGGWRVTVCDDHADPASGPAQSVSISSGGLATSSTTVRRWSAGGRAFHHILDPGTGRSAPITWRTVSVAASSCVDANAATTASIVRGPIAPPWLTGLGLPSRLVSADGDVLAIGGWPQEQGA